MREILMLPFSEQYGGGVEWSSENKERNGGHWKKKWSYQPKTSSDLYSTAKWQVMLMPNPLQLL